MVKAAMRGAPMPFGNSDLGDDMPPDDQSDSPAGPDPLAQIQQMLTQMSPEQLTQLQSLVDEAVAAAQDSTDLDPDKEADDKAETADKENASATRNGQVAASADNPDPDADSDLDFSLPSRR